MIIIVVVCLLVNTFWTRAWHVVLKMENENKKVRIKEPSSKYLYQYYNHQESKFHSILILMNVVYKRLVKYLMIVRWSFRVYPGPTVQGRFLMILNWAPD